MSGFQDPAYLRREQYRDTSNLDARVQLHGRFSANPYGWHRWVLDQVDLPPQARILEIGCGPALLWTTDPGRIPAGWEITLSDFSAGMLRQARRNLASAGCGFRFVLADAQALPFPTQSFDAVIANHMLYHVPDLPRALRLICDVLAPGGLLYAATNGENHLRISEGEWPAGLSRVLGPAAAGPGGLSFNLENGAGQLAPWFAGVRLARYADALVVTEAPPLVAYVRSMAGLDAADVTRLQAWAEDEIAAKGAIRIPKDAGLFIARKEGPAPR